MKTAILAILLFCIMIFPHELGHFIAAKKTGVRVNEFAFGMGPKIWKKQGEETLYSIRLFPIGGFCAMEGEDEDSEDPRSFGSKKPWQKIIVLAAGSFMNVVCAIVIMCLIVGIMGFTTTTIDEVTEKSPAAEGGLVTGDKIVEINHQEIKEWTDVSSMISQTKEKTAVFTVKRNGETVDCKVTPKLTETTDENGNAQKYYSVGITCKISHSPIKAITNGTKATWNLTKTMFAAIGDLFTGKASPDDLSGPVGMVQMVSQTSQYGFWYYGFLTSLICINLAVINMLPLPALDGGRIIFVLYSWITGKKVSEKVEGTIHFVGLALLMLLMVYVTFNDVTRIFG